MKKTLAYSILLFSFLLTSCSDDDNDNKCQTIQCSIPNTELRFDLINEASKKNIFSNNLFEPDLLKVLNTGDQKEEIEFQFLDTENYIISINPIRSTPDVKNYTFKISEEVIFRLETETINNGVDSCCPATLYSKIEISEAKFNVNSQNGNYEIIIE